MTMPNDVPPPPIVCALSEQRQGSQVQVEAEIRSSLARSGSYRLVVMTHGPSGSAQLSQQSAFSVAPNSSVRVQGPRFSLSLDGHYRARLSIRTGDAEYGCEREEADASDRL